jgi:hypothetical protein
MKILGYPKYIILSIIILLVSGLVVFVVDYYNSYQNEKTRVAEEQAHQEAEEEKLREQEFEALRNEIESLKNQPTQTIIQNISPHRSENNTTTLSEVVEQWTPRIAQITCRYALTYGMDESLEKLGVNTDPEYGAGSGFLTQLYDARLRRSVVAVVTNYHVLTGHNGFSPVDMCEVKIGSYTYEINGLYARETKGVESGVMAIGNADGSDKSNIEMIGEVPYKIWDPDAGYLLIENPAPEIENLAQMPARGGCFRIPRHRRNRINHCNEWYYFWH